MDTTRKPFGMRLHELRKAAGLTQASLGKAAGLHSMTISKLELGEREPTWGTLCALADALGVSVGDFEAEAEKSARKKMGDGV